MNKRGTTMNNFMIFEAGELGGDSGSYPTRRALNLQNIVHFRLNDESDVIGFQTPSHYYRVISEEKQATLSRWLWRRLYVESAS